MKETIKIEFSEQSKQVVADVKIEIEDDKEVDGEKVLEKAKKLFDLAHNHAKVKSVQKAIGR